MNIFKIFSQSFRAIMRNKGRSFLTSLGIIIGIASVIALLAIGQGAQNSVTSRLSNLGTTTLTIRSGAGGGLGFGGQRQPGGGGGGQRPGGSGASQTVQKSTLTSADLQSLKDNKTAFKLDQISGYVSDNESLTLAQKDTSGADQQQQYSVIGVEPGYMSIQKLDLASGKLFTSADVDGKAHVVVIGSQAATDLYGSTSPIGKTITLNGAAYAVDGVLQEKPESGFNNPNTQIYAPLSSIADTYSIENYSALYVTSVDEASVDASKAAIEQKLQANHGKTDKTQDFNVTSQKDLLTTVTSATDTFKLLLGGIASISLLVGGIGIMNIMLVAVTERTREIGLRKAVGAKTRHILLQFIIEAVLLCLIGGVLGVLLGVGVANSLGHISGLGFGSRGGSGFTPSVSSASVILAVSVSVLVGLIFGIYPAAKAARLNPIEALRYE